MIVYLALGIISLLANLVMKFMEMPDTFLTGFLDGITVTTALVAMALGIAYATGTLAKLYSFKRRLFNMKN